MEINTKFNFKDRVYGILKKTKREWVKCGFCGGEGMIKGINQKDIRCPDCYGRRGHHIDIGLGWEIEYILTIGEIRIEYRCMHESDEDTMFDNYGSKKEKYKESYMCYETGIGSGSIHNADNLLATEKEALEECEKRNKKEGL
jgi:hypothetical protein